MALTLTSFDGSASAEFKKTLYLNIDGEKYEIGEITHPNGEQLILTYINRVCIGYAEKKIAELQADKTETEETPNKIFDVVGSEDC